MGFGRKIREAREARQWRQEDLAERLGVSQQAVQKWESSTKPPTGSSAFAVLCKTLGLEVSAEDIQAAAREAAEAAALRSAAVAARHAGRRPPTTELISALRDVVPEPRRAHLGALLSVRGLPYRFVYVSPRVVAHAVYGSPAGASQVVVRASAWRLMVALMDNHDHHMKTRHYLLGVVPLVGDDAGATARLPAHTAIEATATGISIEQFTSLEAFAHRLDALEATRTEAEEFHAMMQGVEDDNGAGFDVDDLV